MRKVLIITHDFPGYGTRNVKLIKYLPRFGYEPIIITNRAKKNKYENRVIAYELNDFSYKIFKTVCLNKSPFRIFSKFFNSWTATVYFEKLFFIPDLYITWVPSAFFKGLQIIKRENIDAIITASPPESIHTTGLLLSKMTGVKWIASFEDLWTTRKVAYRPPTILHDIIIKKIERIIYENSDHIIANTHGNREIYINRFNIPAKKITVVTLGYDPEEMPDILNQSVRDENKEFSIGYMGNFDKHGLPCDKFLIAIKKLVSLGDNIKIKVIIYGYISPKTKKFIADHNLTRYVDHRGVVPHFEAYKEVQKCDLLLLMLIEAGYSKAWVPQKLYHYLGMSKPIIAIVEEDGEVAHIINTTNTGNVVSAKKIDGIYNMLVSYYEEWKNAGNIKYKPNTKEIEKYDVMKLTKKLSETITACCNY